MGSLFPALCGTAAVTLFERLERRWLGAEPIYSSFSIAGRLLPARRGQVALGRALRWSYGPLLGVMLQRVLGARRRPVMAEAQAISNGVSAFERVAMPLTRATPELRAWPPRQRTSLKLHTLVFALGVALGRRVAGR